MKQLWQDYEGALRGLEEYTRGNPKDELTRAEATEAMRMSNNVFAREVKNNSMFLALYTPRITSRGTYYKVHDLREHLERLNSRPQDVAELLYYRFCKPDEFGKRYPGKTIEEVFAPGTYLVLGGEN